jgi:ribosome biogenesis protein Nip4
MINKLKLVETFSKAIDRLVNMATSEKPDFFLHLHPQISNQVKKYLELIPGLAPKSWGTYISKSLIERAVRSQAKIIEHFSKVKDLSSLMSMEVDEGKGDVK